MKFITLMGYVAGAFTSFGFMPQMIKGFMTKKVDDVAFWQPLMIAFGTALWLVYGIMLKDLPIILANIISIFFNIIIIIQKVIYKGRG